MDKAAAKVTFNKSHQRKTKKKPGPKTFEGFNADAGSPQIGGPTGGVVLSADQGTLTNSAIAVGKPIRAYGWSAVDWKPTVGVNGEDVSPLANNDSFESQQQALNPEDVPEGTPPLEDPGPYCQCQVFWIKGIVDRTPATELGQCETQYRIDFDIDYRRFRSFGCDPNFTETLNSTGDNTLPGPLGATRIIGAGATICGPNIIRVQIQSGLSQTWLTINERNVFPGGILADTVINSLVFTRADGNPDNCGGQPDTGPPEDLDPGQWYSIKSCQPPISFVINELTAKKQVVVSDQSGEISTLGFDKNAVLSYQIRCAEEGPP